MTWLSEIQNRIAKRYVQAADCGGDELAVDIAVEDGKQMARVIREQSEYMKKVTEIATNALGGMENITEGINKFLVTGVKNELLHIQHHLSSDVKEIINDTTAPSST